MKKLLAISAICFCCISCNKDSSSESNLGSLKISLELQAFGVPIDTTIEYINNSGEKFKISDFKFYVSLVEAVNSTTSVSTRENESYHLVNLADPASQQFIVKMRNGIYDHINFIVGVDSIRNVSGAQTDALDPVNGMFWTWSTGYIFAKLEGKSPSSSAPFQKFTYHIGGFKTGENAIRTISLPATFQIGKTNEIVINVDVLRWFDGVHTIAISNQATIMSPGGNALKMADNYATMFSIDKVVTP